jgi:hypothetical protein
MRPSALIAVLLTVPVLLGGCEDEEIERSREVLRGTYVVDHPAHVGGEKSDSVTLTVTDNRSYVFEHSPYPPDDQVEICSSSGTVGAWGSNVVTFSPEETYGFNCDQIRIPRGEFRADFRTHGDTVWLDKVVNDSTFRLRLIPE